MQIYLFLGTHQNKKRYTQTNHRVNCRMYRGYLVTGQGNSAA